MNKAFDDLIYHSGLIADGCWDELDTYTQEAIERLIELTVRASVGVADDYVKDCTCEEHINCKHPRSAIGRKIREHFGVEE